MPKPKKEVTCDVDTEIPKIMQEMIRSFPDNFDGFDVDRVSVIKVGGRSSKKVFKITTIKSPAMKVHIPAFDYIIEINKKQWDILGSRDRHLWVFRMMCAIPAKLGAFDKDSKYYLKIRKPDYSIFYEEYAVSGQLDWEHNEDAKDPFDVAKQRASIGNIEEN